MSIERIVVEQLKLTRLNQESNPPRSDVPEVVRALPKIELHRHLEGAVRLETLVDVAQQHGIEMPEYTSEVLRPFVQMHPEEPRTAQNFLAKFAVLRQFFMSQGVIARITREAVIDAAADQVKYMELRFTPAALCQVSKCTPEDVVALVCETATTTAAEQGIDVRLIVSINRHESIELGERVLKAALNNRSRGVVGFDLAGKEAEFSAVPFRDIIKKAKVEGLGITLHAGEWEGAPSVWDAVGNLGADRIGHGIRALEDLGMVQIIAARGIVLEVCPSSNVDSGVVPDFKDHPLPVLIEHGVKITINTDDPLVSGITLSDEIHRTMQYLSLSLDDVKQHTLTAAHAAFLPDDERQALVAKFEAWFAPS
ncbi:MAG: adenosine deaminase [bacterium]|nr:adenosine deaminase [bacterium]